MVLDFCNGKDSEKDEALGHASVKENKSQNISDGMGSEKNLKNNCLFKIVLDYL